MTKTLCRVLVCIWRKDKNLSTGPSNVCKQYNSWVFFFGVWSNLDSLFVIFSKTFVIYLPLTKIGDWINPIPTRLFLCSKNQGGGGGHIVPLPCKTPVTLLRIHSNKVFLKACPNWIFWHNFGFHGNHGQRFKVVHNFQIFDPEYLFKNQKPCSSCWKTTKVFFF